MVPLLLACATPSVQTVTLTLAQDTVIDRASPDANFGREPILRVGNGRAVLIRFPELGLRVGAGKRVVSAKLSFSAVGGSVPTIDTVNRLLRPWMEGGVFTPAFATSVAETPVGDSTWNAAMKGVASWGRPGARGEDDAEVLLEAKSQEVDGAVEISGLQRAVQSAIDSPWANFGLRIDFKGDASLLSADAFAGGPELTVVFADDEQRSFPDLVVESFELVSGQWHATVSNQSETAASDVSVFCSINGAQAIESKIAGGVPAKATKSTQVALALPAKVALPSQLRLIVWARASERDARPSDNGMTIYPSGVPIVVAGVSPRGAIELAALTNELVFPLSKFGSAPRGCEERVRVVSSADESAFRVGDQTVDLLRALSGLTDPLLAPFDSEAPVVNGMDAPAFARRADGLGLLPDTRDDVLVPQMLPIPTLMENGAESDVPLSPRGLLSRSETNILNGLIGKRGIDRTLPWNTTPGAIVFRVKSQTGLVPEGARIDVYQLVGGSFGAGPVFSSSVGADGTVLMPSRASQGGGRATPFGDLRPDGSNSWLLAIVTSGGGSAATWVPVWSLWDEYARGNRAAAFIEVPLRARAAAGTGENAAAGRLVTDSDQRFPAQLNVLVDGDPKTMLAMTSVGDGYWLEIDLGRDREIGEIAIEFDGAPWRQFAIVTYKTAQTASDAQAWATEMNGPSHAVARESDGLSVLSFKAKFTRSRYVRILPLTKDPVTIAEIKVLLTG